MVWFYEINADRAKTIVADMKAGRAVQDMVQEYGDSANQSALIKAMVSNNIQRRGPVLLRPLGQVPL